MSEYNVGLKHSFFKVFLNLNLMATWRKMGVKVSSRKTGLNPSNYYWPSRGGTFIAVSFVLSFVM